jgi:hypothetical protein
MAYSTPNIQGTNEQLEAAMRAEMDARSLRCDQLEKTVHLAASLIEVTQAEAIFCVFESFWNLLMAFNTVGLSRLQLFTKEESSTLQLVCKPSVSVDASKFLKIIPAGI